MRVLAAADRGMPRKEAAGVFGVSEPTIRRYLRLRREAGGVEPKPVPGPRPRRAPHWRRRCPPRPGPTPTPRSKSTASCSRSTAAWGSRPPRCLRGAGPGAPSLRPGQRSWWRTTSGRTRGSGAGARRGAGVLAAVPAALPAGLLAHRGGLLEAQGAAAQGRGADPRGARGGDGAGARRGHGAGRAGLVRPSRLPAGRSTVVTTAVRPSSFSTRSSPLPLPL